jgi:transposase
VVNLPGHWCREQEGPSVPARTGSGEVVSTQEFDSMRRELVKVKTERDILKKAIGYFAADPT